MSFSAAFFSFCLQSLPASRFFLMSQLFPSGGQSIGASASVLSVNIQDWFFFRVDWFDLLAVQGTLKSLLQHHSSNKDHELLIAKFRVKTVEKTTRPFRYDLIKFRYDLNQIPYDYTVEVRNRFKGLDLIDRVPDELWTEVRDIVQETGIKTIPKKKKCKKQNGCLRRPYK